MAYRGLRNRAFFVVVLTTFFVAATSSLDEAKALVNFKKSLLNAGSALNGWTALGDPCNGSIWVGVRCVNDKVMVIQLENMGLAGTIDIDSLMSLPYLRSLSLANNSFDGPTPDVKKLVGLKALYLGRNRFSGKIPGDAFSGMVGLRIVYLGQNQFTGELPESLVTLPRLVDLSLEDNRFEGRVPDFPQMELEIVNVANNRLEGPIPKSLSKMSSTFFTGNKDLCGEPLPPCKLHNNLGFFLRP